MLTINKHNVYYVDMEIKVIDKAISFFGEHGAQGRFADAMNVHPMVVSQWKKRQVPAEYVLTVEEVCENTVSRHELRPDLYPKDAWCQCPACLREKAAA